MTCFKIQQENGGVVKVFVFFAWLPSFVVNATQVSRYTSTIFNTNKNKVEGSGQEVDNETQRL